MFGRLRTTPDLDLTMAAATIHQRVSGGLIATLRDPQRLDRWTLRVRLGAPSGGLRDRLERGLTPG